MPFYSAALRRLRRCLMEFDRDNSIQAPMLGESLVEPDIERVLKVRLILNGHVRHKLIDGFF